MVLEFCHGGTLEQKIGNRYFQMSWQDKKFDFAFDIATGMVLFAHSNNIQWVAIQLAFASGILTEQVGFAP